MNDYRILVVDDEEDLCEILKFNLEMEGYMVDTANSAEEALKLECATLQPDTAGRDDGRNFRIQNGQHDEKEQGYTEYSYHFHHCKGYGERYADRFNLGADDYISKPFSLREVIMRVKAVLRRTAGVQTQVPEQLIYKGLSVNIPKKKVTINNEEISLTKKEFEILLLLLQNQGRVFSREDILAKVWHDEVYVLDRTIDVNITRLRKKIGEYGACIVTRLGYGYCFECE